MRLLYMTIGLAALFVSCKSSTSTTDNNESEEQVETEQRVVNVYTHRFYDADKELFKQFEAETGITVNVKTDSDDKLIALLQSEGEQTEADLLMTVDAGRLYYATELDLLQSVTSQVLENKVPAHLREPDGFWYGLTQRARVIAYSKDRVNPAELSTYEDLANEKWKGKISIRSSSNIYNQSLMASIIVHNGQEAAEQWAKGVVANMWQEPKGNDRDQIKNVALGKADLAVVNTYYMGKLANSANELEREAADKVGLFFPNQTERGTHVNVSGAGVTKHAKHTEEALALLEFLVSEQAQRVFAKANYEYPVNPEVEMSAFLSEFGTFQADSIPLYKLGAYNQDAVAGFEKADWK